jgi:hypothetical protein
MTTQEYHFEPGNDLGTFGVYASALLQLIQLAVPNTYHGGIIHSETTPPVTGQPTGYDTDWYAWHKRCIWHVPSTGVLNVYVDGTGWVNIFSVIPANTVTAAMLQSASVTLAKLSPAGGAALQLLRVNAAGTALEFVAPGSAITSFPIASLGGGAAGKVQVLLSSSGANAWTDFDSALLLTLFSNNEIPLNYLAFGAANQVVSMNSAGTGLEWANVTSKIADGTIALTKIAPGSGNSLKVARVNAAGNALEFATISTPSTPNVEAKTDEITSLPAAGSSTSKAHTMGGLPSVIHGMLVNVTPENGYVADEVLAITAVKQDSGAGSSDFSVAYQHSFDATNLTLTSVAAAGGLLMGHKTTGVMATFTPANWKFRFVAVRYY